MNKVVDRIKYILNEKNMSVRELGRLTGIPQTTINRCLTSPDAKITLPKLEKIAAAIGVSPAYLMGWEDDLLVALRPVSAKKIPLLGNVACGEPIFAYETRDAYISVGDDLDADFCLTAKGDSMINARIFDGDILFVKKQSIVNNGEIAVVLVEDEATVKRVYYDKENNIITLMPENPTYKPMRYTGAELDRIRILGKVILGQYVV